MKNDRIFRFHLAGLIVALLWTGLALEPIPARASGHRAFGNGSLKGSYSVLLNKWVAFGDSSSPYGLVGIFDFDGAGNVTITSFSENKGGTVTTGTGSGTYAVKSNGTGSLSVTLSNGNQGTLSIVVNAKGNSFAMMLTSCKNGCGSSVLSGTALATGATSFNNASLKGPYEFSMVKWNSKSNSNAQNDLGILTFDGTGKVKASVTEDKAGTVTKIAASGTYSVNPDGSGALTLTDKKGSITMAFGITSASKGAQLLETACGQGGCQGEVQTGTATHQ